MVRRMVVCAVALGLMAAPPVGQALENALLALSPGFGRHLEGGLIKMTLYQSTPAAPPDERTCYSVHVEPHAGKTPLHEPSDSASACTWGSHAIVYLQANEARGRLVVVQGGQEAYFPYLVPDGMSESAWAGVEDGVLRIGVSGTLTPLDDAKEVTWAAAGAFAFLAVLVFLVVRVHALWTLAALLAAMVSYAKTYDAWGVPLPTVPLWAIGAAAVLCLASMAYPAGRIFPPRARPVAPPDVSRDLPRLDAVGLREDLR